MCKIVLLSLLAWILINLTSAHQFNFLKGFELNNPLIEKEGSFYRLNATLEKDFKTEELFHKKVLEDFYIESVFRFNGESDLFHLLTLGDKYSGHSIIFSMKNSDEFPMIRVTFKENSQSYITYLTNSKRIVDGRWHKIVISFSHGYVRAWLDCEYMESRFDVPEIVERVNFESKELQHVQIAVEDKEGLNNFDIQKLMLYSGPSELISIDCNDIPGRNLIQRHSLTQIDFLKVFDLNNFLHSNDGNFHRFNGPYMQDLKISESFVSESIDNIVFECVFRFNVSQNDDIALLELRDRIYDQSIQFYVGNYESLALQEFDHKTHNAMFVRAALKNNKKLFDGKWHKVIFSYSQKQVKFWVDCELIRSNSSWFTQPAHFLSVLQNITLIGSSNGIVHRDFDVMKMKLYSNMPEDFSDFCHDLPKKSQVFVYGN